MPWLQIGVSTLMLSASSLLAEAQEIAPVPETPTEVVPPETPAELADPQGPKLLGMAPPERISMSRACIVSASLQMRNVLSFRVRSRDRQMQGYLIPHQEGIRFINGSGTTARDMAGIRRIQPQDPLSANTEALLAAFMQEKAIHIIAVDPEKPYHRWVYDVQSIFLTHADCE